MTMFLNYLGGDNMVKIIMRRVPSKTDYNVQHKVIKRWCEVVVSDYVPKQEIHIISAKELRENKQLYSAKAK